MAGRTSGAERDARRILAEAGVAAIDDLRGQVAALEARLAGVERERDAAVARLREIEAGAPAVRELRDAAVALADMVEEAAREDVPGILGRRALRAEERLAALTQAAGEAADLLGIVASYVESDDDAGIGQTQWARDARRVETALRAVMGETNG